MIENLVLLINDVENWIENIRKLIRIPIYYFGTLIQNLMDNLQ
jgi:hypothetical protein